MVIDETVEFEKELFEDQDSRKLSIILENKLVKLILKN